MNYVKPSSWVWSWRPTVPAWGQDYWKASLVCTANVKSGPYSKTKTSNQLRVTMPAGSAAPHLTIGFAEWLERQLSGIRVLCWARALLYGPGWLGIWYVGTVIALSPAILRGAGITGVGQHAQVLKSVFSSFPPSVLLRPFVFETGSHAIALTGLESAMREQAVSNLSCLC